MWAWRAGPRPLRPPSGLTLVSLGLRYGLAASYLVTLYVLVLVLGGVSQAHPEPPWWAHGLALLAVALTLRPVDRWLHRTVDRLVYDWQDDPYAVLAEVGQQLDPAAVQEMGAIMPTIARAIAESLRLPYVSITSALAHQPSTATFGQRDPRSAVQAMPLSFGGVQIGRLEVTARRPGESLSASDERLLRDLARQVSIALHATQLGQSLQDARERLVIAREEERRRIRRDLHDGLAPTLASVRMQLGALRRLVRDDPAAAEHLLDELRADVRTATADIRRLVYDLRPPLLDEHGLGGALGDLVGVVEAGVLTVEIPADLPLLPPAVEVAAYRVASEAVHNIARHAQARHATLRLELSAAALVLTVADDGVGLPDPPPVGVGMASMQERASELGGRLTVRVPAGGGTQLTATFPLQGRQP